jgi:hypothetical protein
MAVVKGNVILQAAGTIVQSIVDTNISGDSKFGWMIEGFKGTMLSAGVGGVEVPEAYRTDLTLSTQATTITTPDDEDEIARVSWGLTYSAAGLADFEPSKLGVLLEPRLTVQPLLYVSAVSAVALTSVNTFYYEIRYSVVKLTDVELLRLLIGGA